MSIYCLSFKINLGVTAIIKNLYEHTYYTLIQTSLFHFEPNSAVHADGAEGKV